MKQLILLSLLLSTIISSGQNKKIHYFNNDTNSILKAVVNDKVYTLIDSTDFEPNGFSTELIADFNKNGYNDILINYSGGNCCGSQYTIFTFNGTKFIKTQKFGSDFNEIEISESSIGYNFIVDVINEGAGNTDFCKNKIETYRLNDNSLELINTIQENIFKAVTEIKSADFKDLEDDELYLNFDLDGDGKLDIITCSYWERWGRISTWKIIFSSGLSFSGESTPKRIGILNTKTNGINDLVLDCDEILKWSNGKYQ